MPSDRNVDTIIVNYKTPDLTIHAVKSVLAEPETASVIVVDNASGDGSAAKLTAEFANTPSVKIIASDKNLGFGGGNNLGAENATAEYIFLLNSDAFVRPGCLAALRKTLVENPNIGLVAPAVYLKETGALQDATHGVFPTPANIFLRRNTVTTADLAPDWISGVAFLARREEFRKIGGFDLDYFMYYEDVDLCRRYHQSGYRMQREMSAEIVHALGQSMNMAARRKAAYESQDVYLKKSGVGPFTRAMVSVCRTVFNRLRNFK